MTDKKIKVIIVDDHMVVRRGLSHVIQSFNNIELVAEAKSGEQALFLCHQHQPDVVLMDVKMEGMGGIAATQSIRKFHPQTQVVALSTFQNKDLVEKMIQAGAIGYILKDISAKGLAGAIRSAHAGESAFAPEIVQALRSTAPPSDLPSANLSAPRKGAGVDSCRIEQRRNCHTVEHFPLYSPVSR